MLYCLKNFSRVSQKVLKVIYFVQHLKQARSGVGNPWLVPLFRPSAVAPCSVGVQYAGDVSPRLLIQHKLLPCTFSRSSVLK